MIVDFQKLQEEVSDIRAMLLTLTGKQNQQTPPLSVEESPLTVQQAADLLDVTTATIYDLVHKRRIPSHRPGKRLYFLHSELLQWIKNGRRSTTDELAIDVATRPTRQVRKGGHKVA